MRIFNEFGHLTKKPGFCTGVLAEENDPILATAGENAEQVDDDAEPQ